MTLRLLLPFLLLLCTAGLARAQSDFTPAELARFDAKLAELVADDEIVGGEVLILQDGKVLLQAAHGWSDREAERALVADQVYCVRSMTKPFIGVAIMMLVEEGKIDLSAPAFNYLPALDVDGYRTITVSHLMHHQAGFPMSLLGAEYKKLKSIASVAALGPTSDLQFVPGTKFSYSDQGTDTLTAIVEAVSGMTAHAFVQQRILDPLGMSESMLVFPEDHPLRARASSKYVGAPKEWRRYWKPEDEQLFPFFLGSQSMHSTTKDYARFAEFLLDQGRVGEKALISEESWKALMTPGVHTMQGPSELPDTLMNYGQQMVLWRTQDGEDSRNLAYGHTGSDGTHCWIFPDSKTIVLYFTQSRGTLSGFEFEALLSEALFDVPVETSKDVPPFDDYLGYYSEGGNDKYRAIVRDGDSLGYEILGRATVELVHVEGDSWKIKLEPTNVLDFQRNDAGEITGYKIGDHEEFRVQQDPTWPTGEELAERVLAVHRLDRLQELGTMKVRSSLSMPSLGVEGETVSHYAWPNRFRMETTMGPEFENVAYDGEVVTYATGAEAAAPLTDPARAQRARKDQYLARFGDLRHWHDHLEVIQHLELGGTMMYLLRAGSTDAPGRTFYIEAETGRMRGEDTLTVIPGVGRLGQKIRFDDFREVNGMLFPHRTRVQFPTPMLGRVTLLVEELEVGVEAPSFRLDS